MLPPERTDAVARGLREAFGVDAFEDLAVVTGGQTSSLVFRIVVRGSPYLLKIITRTEDPTRHYSSMKAAADAGIAPRVWYTNAEHRISITNFVEAQPLPVSEALGRLPAVLRKLHALPAFGRAPFNTTCTFLLNQAPLSTGAPRDGYLQQFLTSNILSQGDAEEFAARCAEIAAIYPYDDGEMVSSHNDLYKPDNILFDGTCVWLVDWEAAFLNDRYADLAVVANQVVTNAEEERSYLCTYFGGEPDAYQSARFHVMQQVAHLFYTMAFLSLGSKRKPVDWSDAIPSFEEFHRRVWAGELDLADKDVTVVHGRVHWAQLLRNVGQARYREALSILADRATVARTSSGATGSPRAV